jgi:hypothetical protein
LEENERNQEEHKESEAVDYSVFEFNDSDSDGSLEIVFPDAAAAVEEGAADSPKIEDSKAHREQAYRDYRKLSPKMSVAIGLMDRMNCKGGFTMLFNAVLEWHIKHIDCTDKMTDAALHKKLIKGYNLQDTKPFEFANMLPSSKATVSLACPDYLFQVTALLTDSRHSDDDCLFLTMIHFRIHLPNRKQSQMSTLDFHSGRLMQH